MAANAHEMVPIDNSANDDHDRLERPGNSGGPRNRGRSTQPDTGAKQIQRDARANAERVIELLRNNVASNVHNTQAAVQPLTELTNSRDPVPIYSAPPIVAAAEGMHLNPSTGEYGPVPALSHELVVYAAKEGLTMPEFLDLMSSKMVLLDDQATNLKKSHETALRETQKALKGRNGYRVATIILGLFTLVGAVASAALGVLYSQKAASNNLPGSGGDDDFVVNDYKSDGYMAGRPARADVLAYDVGVAPDTIAIVGADPAKKTLEVVGEGVWSIDDKFRVIFSPVKGFLGSPKEQKYVVASAADKSKTKEGRIVFVYDGDFKVDGIIQTTFIKGKAAEVAFLKDAVGADPDSAAIVGADANSNGLVKTVAGQGKWILDKAKQVITFTPDAGFVGNPDVINFSVKAKADVRTVERPIVLVDKHPALMDQIKKSDPAASFTVSGFSQPGLVLDQKSLSIDNGTPNGAKDLTVAGEGKWSIDAAGVLSFTADPALRGLPGAIKLTIADTLGRRSAAFKLTPVPYNEPYTLNEFQTPKSSIAQMAGTTITCVAASNAIAGDFKINFASTEILGLAPFDNTIPTANFVTPGTELSVTGEGSWKVNSNGTISFTFGANPVRWPTPIAYTVKDEKGNESNVSTVWITPPEASDITLRLAGANEATDDDFWTKYHDNVLMKQVTLGELIAATFLLERSAYLSLNPPSKMAQIDSVTVVTSALVDSTAMDWATKYSASPTSLTDVTAFLDNAYVDGLAVAQGLPKYGSSIALGTRIIRLRLIRALLHKIMN